MNERRSELYHMKIKSHVTDYHKAKEANMKLKDDYQKFEDNYRRLKEMQVSEIKKRVEQKQNKIDSIKSTRQR